MNEKLIFFLGFVIEIRSCVTDFSFGRKKIWFLNAKINSIPEKERKMMTKLLIIITLNELTSSFDDDDDYHLQRTKK